MTDHPVIKTLMNHRSIRRYAGEMPSDELVAAIVRAGQQAPFAYQLGSVLLRRGPEATPFRAPLYFTICIDLHRIELIMARRGWKTASNDLHLLLFGMEDAIMMAQNMVVAAEALGLGTCYIGAAQYRSDAIAEEYSLPPRVFPAVGIAMGFPAEDPPCRPRYPLEFTLFEGRYPELDDAAVERAMKVMDDGYLAQDYYRGNQYMVPLDGTREEQFTFDTYSWTEHISRKLGLWGAELKPLIEALARRGFNITGERSDKPDSRED